MQPKLIRRGTGEHTSEDLVRVKLPGTDGEYALDPLAGLVWTLSDGSRTLEAVSAAAAEALKRRITREEVFLALDFLADAGLMERVAPPAAEVDLARRAAHRRSIIPFYSDHLYSQVDLSDPSKVSSFHPLRRFPPIDCERDFQDDALSTLQSCLRTKYRTTPPAPAAESK